MGSCLRRLAVLMLGALVVPMPGEVGSIQLYGGMVLMVLHCSVGCRGISMALLSVLVAG